MSESQTVLAACRKWTRNLNATTRQTQLLTSTSLTSGTLLTHFIVVSCRQRSFEALLSPCVAVTLTGLSGEEAAVSVCRLKQEGLKQEVLAQRTTLGQSNSAIHELHHDIHDVVQSLQARFHPACCRPALCSKNIPSVPILQRFKEI